MKSTTAGAIFLRLRVSGADDTTSNFYLHGMYSASNSTSYLGQTQQADSSLALVPGIGATDIQYGEITIFNPFLANPTTFIGTTGIWSGSINYGGAISGVHNLSSSFTGVTLFTSGGTQVGSISVFGVAK